jgi:hypothetical protein
MKYAVWAILALTFIHTWLLISILLTLGRVMADLALGGVDRT